MIEIINLTVFSPFYFYNIDISGTTYSTKLRISLYVPIVILEGTVSQFLNGLVYIL